MTTQTGQTFGRFHILEELVAGHEARVFRAYDPSQDRQLALTVLPVRPATAGGDPKAVLQRARKLLELKHPHIVRIEHAGLAADSLYLESPLVEATSLADRLSHGPLGVPEAARYFEQIVSALELAHSRGVLHLALRSEHIWIDSYGNAMVHGFGQALAEGERVEQAEASPSQNELHRAPEQDRGVTSDARADQFALGALLFRMLTGYTTSNPGMPVGELIRRMNERTARLSTGPRPIPRAIAGVIVKASSWDPNDRYKSLQEMQQTFRQAAASILETRSRLRSEEERLPVESSLEPGLPAPPADVRFWARPQVRIGAVTVLLAFLLAGYGLVSAGALKPFGIRSAETEAVPLIDGGQLTAMAGTIEALSTQVVGNEPEVTPTLSASDDQPAVLSLTGSPTAGPLAETLEPGLSPTGPATTAVLETPGAGPTATPAANPGGATQPPVPTSPPAGPTNTSIPPTNLPPPTNPPPTNTAPPPATSTPPPAPTATPAPTNTSPPPPTNTPIIPLPTVTLPLP